MTCPAVLQGVTTYFSANCTDHDAEKVKQYMKHKNMEPYNNRLFKTVVDGVSHYEVRPASGLGGAWIGHSSDQDAVIKHSCFGFDLLST